MTKNISNSFLFALFLLILSGCNSTTQVKNEPDQKTYSETLSGKWISRDFTNAHGPLKVKMNRDNNSQLTGELIFEKSSCPWWKPLSGHIGNSGSITISSNLGGKCGEITINMAPTENGGFAGEYIAEYPDRGEVQLQ